MKKHILLLVALVFAATTWTQAQTILDFKLALKIDRYADTNDIEQVRMQGNFGMHESGYGRYWCSTDKKWKTRKGPKQKRSS
jgi:hypothetical protein